MEIHFDCSGCGAPLADIYVTPTNENINWSAYAKCPHCGDRSYLKEFEGMFSLYNNESTLEYTIVENFDPETSPIVLETVKVKDYVA